MEMRVKQGQGYTGAKLATEVANLGDPDSLSLRLLRPAGVPRSRRKFKLFV